VCAIRGCIEGALSIASLAYPQGFHTDGNRMYRRRTVVDKRLSSSALCKLDLLYSRGGACRTHSVCVLGTEGTNDPRLASVEQSELIKYRKFRTHLVGCQPRIGFPIMQLPDLHCAIDQLINHVLIPWHDERAAVQPRISLHQPFNHSIWSLFGPPFVCLPCVVTFLSLSVPNTPTNNCA